MKLSLINLDYENRTFQIHLSDITQEYYDGIVEWYVDQDTINHYNMTFEIPYGVKEWTSEPIDKYLSGYDYMGREEYMYFSGGISYSLSFTVFSYGREEILANYDYILWFVITGGKPYIYSFTINQLGFDGNVHCKCLLQNIYTGEDPMLFRTYVNLYDETSRLIARWYLHDGSDIGQSNINITQSWEYMTINGQNLYGLVLNWSMLVGNEFYKKKTFTLVVDNHVRPTYDDAWEIITSDSCHASITLLKEDAPDCLLPVIYRSVNVEDSFKKEIIGVIEDYPVIYAKDWNQFCKDINTVRKNAYPTPLNEWFFYEVKSGEAISGFLHFNNLYDAIADMCPSGTDIKPPTLDGIGLMSGAEFSGNAIGKFITSLVQTAQACRNHYWGINE